MKHQASPRFWHCYNQLPADAQRIANGCFEVLRRDPRHPSLHFKKIGRLWSVRIGLHYRALGAEKEGSVVWFWIGSHSEYDKLLGRR